MAQRPILGPTPPTYNPALLIGEQSDRHIVLYHHHEREVGSAVACLTSGLVCLLIWHAYPCVTSYTTVLPIAAIFILLGISALRTSSFAWEFDRASDCWAFYSPCGNRLWERPLSEIADVELRDLEPMCKKPDYDLQLRLRDGSRRSLLQAGVPTIPANDGKLVRPSCHPSDDYAGHDYAGLVFPYRALGALLGGSAITPEFPPMAEISPA